MAKKTAVKKAGGTKATDAAGLSKLVSVLWAMCEETLAEVEGDLRGFRAPAECYDIAFAGVGREALRTIRAAGYADADELEAAIVARTSERWLHLSTPLPELLDLAQRASERPVRRAA